MPLCTYCHHDLHALSGQFKHFNRAGLRDWQDLAVAATQRLLLADNDNGEAF